MKGRQDVDQEQEPGAERGEHDEPLEPASALGDGVTTGQHLGDCGNSGNSTQPHLHIQVMDNPAVTVARGVPMAFRRFREWRSGASGYQIKEFALPGEGAVVERLQDGDPSGL
jgi:hypothetical protein